MTYICLMAARSIEQIIIVTVNNCRLLHRDHSPSYVRLQSTNLMDSLARSNSAEPHMMGMLCTWHGASHAVGEPHNRAIACTDGADAVQRPGHTRAVVRPEQHLRQRLHVLATRCRRGRPELFRIYCNSQKLRA